MRKGLTTFLVILLALGAVLVSCKAEIEAPADELVSVSFEMGSSRALSATLEEFDKTEFYWYYAAVKTDGTGLISGQTDAYDCLKAVPVDKTGKGLGGQIPGFSQGIWSFKLFAYFERPTTDEERAAFIYSGEATDVVLQKNSGTGNKVTVIVGPNPTGDGFLFIDKEHIYLEEASTASHNEVSPVIGIEVIQGDTPVFVPDTNAMYKAETGTYRVTVSYTDGFITYATGSVIATVYPGLTTTVSGYVDELVTYAQFDAVENPDIVRETWGSTITNNTASEGNISLTKDATESKTTKVTSATMPAKAAVDKMNELATNVGADAGTSSMKLNLNVDTTEATETKVKYDIGMEAELTYQKNGQASTSKSDVKNIDDYVIVVINLASDITDVSVTHSGVAMIKFTDYDEFIAATVENDEHINPADPSEGYKGFYCLSTENNARKLYIKTRSFSPFEVTYTMTDYVASMDGKKYTSLAAAVDAIDNNNLHTITLLKDHSGAGIGLFNADGDTARNIVIDLGGYTFTCTGPAVGSTGTETQAFHLEKGNTVTEKGNTVTIKNGTVTCTVTSGVKMLVQNYCNLTLEDVAVDGTNLPGTGRYVLSGNNGDILITGTTDITAKTGDYAFDVCYTGYYPDGVRYVFDENYTGTVTGTIQFDVWGTLPATTYCSLTIKAGTFTGEFDIEEALRDRAKNDIHISGGSFGDYVAFGFNANKMYSSLTIAINEANSTTNTDKVLLLKDVQMSKLSKDDNVAVSVDKNLILDGCSHTLYSTAGRGIWIDADDVSLKIENLTVEGSSELERAVQVNGNVTGVNLVIDNCVLTSTMYAINYCINTTGNTVITNSKVTGWGALNVWSNGNSIEATDCSFIGINDKGYNAEGWNDFGTIVLEADTTEQTAHGASGMQITLTRCNIIGKVTTGNTQFLILFNHNCDEGAYGNSVLATSCSFGYEIEDGNCEVTLDAGTGNTFTAVNCTLNDEPYSKN